MSEITSFKWKIDDLYTTHEKHVQTCGGSFALTNQPSTKFALFLDTRDRDNTNVYVGVILKEVGSVESLDVDIHFWLEDYQGTKFMMNTVQKHTFEKTGDLCQFKVGTFDSTWKSNYWYAYGYSRSLTVCCEIKCLAPPVPPVKPPKLISNLMWELYNNGQATDAVIQVEGREFKIHANIFAARSAAFMEMFYTNFKEGITKKVMIKDTSANAMEAFVCWIYLGDIPNKNFVEDLFVLGDKYLIDDLKDQCASLMYQDLTEINAARRLSLAILHKNDVLKKYILDFIAQLDAEKRLHVMESKEWCDYLVKRHNLDQ